MAKAKRNSKVNPLLDLEDSLSGEIPIPYSTKGSKNPIKEINEPEQSDTQDSSLISSELAKFELQIKEIFVTLESINPLAIIDLEERLKVVKLKMDIQLKLPLLLKSLDDLRNKEKLKAEQIKGNKDISPLEDGSLDD